MLTACQRLRSKHLPKPCQWSDLLEWLLRCELEVTGHPVARPSLGAGHSQAMWKTGSSSQALEPE